MKKIADFFHRVFESKIFIIIVSAVLGVFLWLLLSNVQDPVITTTLKIPVTYLNEDLLLSQENLVLLDRPSEVQISVSTKTSALQKLSPDMFVCKADLTDHSGGDLLNQRVHIQVFVAEHASEILDWDYYKNDPSILVSMDGNTSKEFAVTLLPTENLPGNMILTNTPLFNPQTITVSGPASHFANVAYVMAPVSLKDFSEGRDGTFIKEVDLVLYDGAGQPISDHDLELNSGKALATLEFASTCSVAVIAPETSGQLPDGYAVTSMKINPNRITIQGARENLSLIETVKIPAELLNLEGATETKEFDIALDSLLPSGVTVASDVREAKITVEIKRIFTKTITIEEGDIKLNGTSAAKKYTIISPKSFQVTVSGNSESVLELTAQDIYPAMDVKTMKDGENEGTLTFSLPTGYSWQGEHEFTAEVLVENN